LLAIEKKDATSKTNQIKRIKGDVFNEIFKEFFHLTNAQENEK
jgi:hypothetical protein